MSKERLYLFDTTLRDGAQMNGVDFTVADKIAIAGMLDDLGIDYVERRQALIDAITLEDAQRVAKRLFAGGLLVTVVGRPQGVAAKDPGG